MPEGELGERLCLWLKVTANYKDSPVATIPQILFPGDPLHHPIPPPQTPADFIGLGTVYTSLKNR